MWPGCDLREALLGGALQFGATQHEVADGVLQRLLLLGVQRLGVDGLVLGVQAFIGAQARPEVGDLGQRFVVRGAQFRAVGHCVQVADHAPGHAELLGGDVEDFRDLVPGAGKLRLGDRVQRAVSLGAQLFDGGRYVFGADLVESRQVVDGEEGIAHAPDFEAQAPISMFRRRGSAAGSPGGP